MKALAVFYNPTVDTWSMLYNAPHYPLAHSLSTVTVNVRDLPELVAEKVALLRLVRVGDNIVGLGTRTGETKYVVYLPEDYEIKGLET